MPETIAITREQLRKALWQWETASREGKTRSIEETRALSIDQVANESAASLWDRLQKLANAS